MPESTSKPSSPSLSSAKSKGKAKPVERAPEPVASAPTGAPKLTGAYKAKTCLKYLSARSGKTINAKPGKILRDLSEVDIAKFRLSGAIEILIEG